MTVALVATLPAVVFACRFLESFLVRVGCKISVTYDVAVLKSCLLVRPRPKTVRSWLLPIEGFEGSILLLLLCAMILGELKLIIGDLAWLCDGVTRWSVPGDSNCCEGSYSCLLARLLLLLGWTGTRKKLFLVSEIATLSP